MISIVNLHRRYRIDEALARRIVLRTLHHLGKPASTDIEIVFLDDRAMRRFNRLYKKHDRFTDVLSFRLDGKEFGVRNFLGEILISVDRAKHNSVVFERPFSEELVRYAIHGVLHLFGYDDESRADKAVMYSAENRVLGSICAKEDLSKVLTRL